MPKRKTQPAASAAAAPRATKAKHGMQLLPRDVDHLSTVQRARLSFEPPLPPSMASLGTGERAAIDVVAERTRSGLGARRRSVRLPGQLGASRSRGQGRGRRGG